LFGFKKDEIRHSLGRTVIKPDGLTRAQPLDAESSQSRLLAPFPGIKLEADGPGAQAEIVKKFHLAMFADPSLDLGASPVRGSESTNVMVAKVSNLQNISSLFVAFLVISS
jgi:hypothetical protein